MNVEQQIQFLIEQAPQYGANPKDISTIAPALTAIAKRLKHPQYFVLQTLEQNWLMTTLSHRTQPGMTKNVVYAFPTLKDAAASPQAPSNDPQVVALPLPVIQILFQMLAMKPVDSIVFFETPGNLKSGTEVTRQNLQDMIRTVVQQQRQKPNLPPDIA
ncbi:hypothetical protein C7B61_01485 [filamentous cyanobacterium CCP1]|nr:hypothetical protein C7B76_05835 [filamentous cyanobacterium CCP2]PSB68321.1 hypothetical protein C7B61_01485 [filamentous cyanobacterium CCP1]